MISSWIERWRDGEISTDSKISKKQGLGGTATQGTNEKKKMLLGLSQARPATGSHISVSKQGTL